MKITASVSFPALGTTAYVAVTRREALDAARAAVADVIDEFDRGCSRFRDDSDLARVNDGAGSAVAAGPVLIEAVSQALRAAQLTAGDVDPTVGAALIALGYDRDFADIGRGATPMRGSALVPVPGWRTVQVDRDRSLVRVPRGVRLDLGATAKALASDHAAVRAHAAAESGVLVGLGGDFATAGEPPDGGWRIRVTDDHRAGFGAPGQWIALSSGGLATSSTTTRRWRSATGEAHHLVDPATGAPADGSWRTVSVAAATCLDANIASTAAVIRGAPAVAWLESLGLPSRLVSSDGRVVHLAGWPVQRDDLAELEPQAGVVA